MSSEAAEEPPTAETTEQSSTSSLPGEQNPTTPASSTSSALLTCAFNQDGGCLAIGTTSGFSVHNVHPQYSVSVDRPLRGGGIGRIEMLFRCNLMALVGGGPTPHGAPHRVWMWDDHIPKEIGELCFRQTVLRVKLRKDAIAVALKDRVYVYQLADLSLRDKIYTADNPDGLLAVSTQVSDMVLACPSVTVGHVRVEVYGMRKTVLLEAHDGVLKALALTADGKYLATASTKGTVLRVFSVASSSCLHEFRRGVERVNITCLAWSWDANWLACTSDKGTAHVFHVGISGSDSTTNGISNGTSNSVNNSSTASSPSPSKKSSSLTSRLFTSVMKTVDGGSEAKKKSVCQIRGVPHPLACSFVADAPNVLAVAGWDADGNGVLLTSEFAAHQEPRRIAYHVVCKSYNSTNGSGGVSSTVIGSSEFLEDGDATDGDGGIPNETDEQRRRRRARGWKPSIPATNNTGRIVVGDRMDDLEAVMQQIEFDENGLDGEFDFVGVTTRPVADEPKITTEAVGGEGSESPEDDKHKEKDKAVIPDEFGAADAGAGSCLDATQ